MRPQTTKEKYKEGPDVGVFPGPHVERQQETITIKIMKIVLKQWTNTVEIIFTSSEWANNFVGILPSYHWSFKALQQQNVVLATPADPFTRDTIIKFLDENYLGHPSPVMQKTIRWGAFLGPVYEVPYVLSVTQAATSRHMLNL
jgi:hypothetical protein